LTQERSDWLPTPSWIATRWLRRGARRRSRRSPPDHADCSLTKFTWV